MNPRVASGRRVVGLGEPPPPHQTGLRMWPQGALWGGESPPGSSPGVKPGLRGCSETATHLNNLSYLWKERAASGLGVKEDTEVGDMFERG